MYCISDQSLKRQRIEWECDICKVAKFPTYEEALEHEQSCTGSDLTVHKITSLSPSIDKKGRECSDTISLGNNKNVRNSSPTATVSPTFETYSEGKKDRCEPDLSEINDEPVFNPPEIVDISESPLTEKLLPSNKIQKILAPNRSVKLDNTKAILQPMRRSCRKKKSTKSIEFKSIRPPAPIFERAKKKDTQIRRTTTKSLSQLKKKKSDAPLASIFMKKHKTQSPTSKEVLAQHRAAEYMAKRKADAEKERAKNMKKKRQAIATIFQPASKKDKNNENDIKSKKENNIFQCDTYPPPLFPNLAHIIQTDPFNALKEQRRKYHFLNDATLRKSNRALLQYSRYPHEKPNNIQKYNELSIILPREKDLKTNTYDPIYHLFDQTFSIRSNYNKSAMLYTQKYPCAISLEDNPTAQHLTDFLRPYASKELSSTSSSQGTIISDWNSNCSLIDSDTEASGDSNIFILTGPTSCGKTSMVYSCVENMDCFHILEINSSMRRGGSALRSAIEEATLSHRLMRKGKGLDGEKMKKALILIDEVENLFPEDGDAGFWASLYQLSKKSKSPIILTASSIPSALTQIFSNFEHGDVSLPTAKQCAQRLFKVASKENILIKNNSNCEKIAEMMNCDLRKILLELQCWALTGGNEINYDTPQHEPFRESYDTCKILYSPKIFSISPKVLPTSQYTPITIVGNFNHPKNTTLDVTLGLKHITFRKLSTSIIIAIVPPLTVSEKIDDFGFYKDSELECMSLKYPLINVRIVQRGGIVVPDKENIRLEYVFSTFDGLEFCNKRKEKEKHNHLGKTAESKKSQISVDEDTAYDDKKYENYNDNEMMTMQGKCSILASEQRNTEFNNQKSLSDNHPPNCMEHNILEKATKEYYDRIDMKQEVDSSAVNVGIEMSEYTKRCLVNDLSDVNELDRYCSVMSEAMYFDDMLNINRLPFLSGSVQGIGNPTTDQSKKVLEEQPKLQPKPPSFEKLFATSTTTSSLYHGCSNAYVTHGMTMRERGLLAREANSSSLDSNQIESREDVCSDDKLANYEKSVPLSLLPHMLKESVNKPCLRFPQIQQDTLNFKRWKKQHDSIQLVMQLTADAGIERMNSVCFGTNFDDEIIELSPGMSDLSEYLDPRLVLDYLPVLRTIAHTENMSEKEYACSNEETQTRNEDQKSTRRSSGRKTKKGRRHYFASFLRGVGSLSKEKIGRKIGDTLSRFYIAKDFS